MITVREHTRRPPETKPDPFATVMEARRRKFAAKWGVPLVGANDSRLEAPVAEPAQGGRTLADITDGLRALAAVMMKIGRT